MSSKFPSALVAGAFGAALVLAGCAGGGGGDGTPGATDGAGGDEMYIALVSKGFQHQFWQAVKQGAEEKAAEPRNKARRPANK